MKVDNNLFGVINNRREEIIGSKSLADRIVRSVAPLYGAEKEIKYYSSEKILDRVAVVKNEWKNTDLLIYTPTISWAMKDVNVAAQVCHRADNLAGEQSHFIRQSEVFES